MGRSTKAISLVLIGPALLGSTFVISGCVAEVEPSPELEPSDWVVAEGDEQGESWGTPEEGAQQGQHQDGTTHTGHRSNVGGLIGGFIGARAASSAARGGVSSAPSGGMSPNVGGGSSSVGGASARGGFGSSAVGSSSAT